MTLLAVDTSPLFATQYVSKDLIHFSYLDLPDSLFKKESLMRQMAVVSVVLVFTSLVGCASWLGSNKSPVVVDYHMGTTELSGYPKAINGIDDFIVGVAGTEENRPFGPYSVRKCNSDRTACSLGLVALTSTLRTLSVGDTEAELQIKIDYQVGTEWRLDYEGGSQVHKLPVSDALNDRGSVSHTSRIPYGEVRQVALPYGLSFTLCVSPPGVSAMSVRSCSQKINGQNLSSIPLF